MVFFTSWKKVFEVLNTNLYREITVSYTLCLLSECNCVGSNIRKLIKLARFCSISIRPVKNYCPI